MKHICVTDRHDMTLAVKVALNPNTANQIEFNTHKEKEIRVQREIILVSR